VLNLDGPGVLRRGFLLAQKRPDLKLDQANTNTYCFLSPKGETMKQAPATMSRPKMIDEIVIVGSF